MIFLEYIKKSRLQNKNGSALGESAELGSTQNKPGFSKLTYPEIVTIPQPELNHSPGTSYY
jgi:hypothetical protein